MGSTPWMLIVLALCNVCIIDEIMHTYVPEHNIIPPFIAGSITWVNVYWCITLHITHSACNYCWSILNTKQVQVCLKKTIPDLIIQYFNFNIVMVTVTLGSHSQMSPFTCLHKTYWGGGAKPNNIIFIN